MQPSYPTPVDDLPRQSLDLAFRALWKHRPDALATVALGKPVLAVQTEPAAVLVTERAPDGADTLLDAPDHHAGLLALVPLARGATKEHLVRAARRLQALGSPDAPDLAVVSVMLGSRRFGYTDLIRIFREEFLMLGDAWANIENRGFEKGVLQGRQEGREEGRHAAARAALHTFATARFGQVLDGVLATVTNDQLEAAIAAVAAAPDADIARERLGELGR